MIVHGSRYGWQTVLFEGDRRACLNWIFENCDVGDLIQKNGRWCGYAYFEDSGGCVFVIRLDDF